MSENNATQAKLPDQSKQYLLAALVILLVGIVGFQSWYMMSMKQQMETIQGMVTNVDHGVLTITVPKVS
jgi:hypothetical protein